MTTEEATGVVIIGAGQAGVTAATTLREKGWRGPIHLIGAEDGAPYQRPPLSKSFLHGSDTEDDIVLSTVDALHRDEILYTDGDRVVALDRESRAILLASGLTLSYDILILATGSRARRLPVPGVALEGVLTLRDKKDALQLGTRIRESRGVVIVGGGFLGLEVAAAVVKAGRPVTVLERSAQLLRGAVGPTIGDHLAAVHDSHGVNIRFLSEVTSFIGDDRLEGVLLSDTSTFNSDLALVAIGAAPTVELAERSGLKTADGIVVNSRLRTSDPGIYAIGDCARYPHAHAGSELRLESVQNAVDQARFVAAQILADDDGPYRRLPWFWSHQYDQNLQIAGLALPTDDESALEPSRDGALAVARERDGMLVAVETINDPKTHMRARRALANSPIPIGSLADLTAQQRIATA